MPKLEKRTKMARLQKITFISYPMFCYFDSSDCQDSRQPRAQRSIKSAFPTVFEWNLSDILQERRILPDWILNVQQHKRSPMPQAQSLKLSSKATVQHAGVVLGQVRVLEGLENLIERPARNTRNAKAR